MGTQLLDAVVAVRPETAVWWGQARRDFVLARRNHEHRDYDAAVFFCEQAAQKALKALLLHRTGVMPPRTHNLDELGERAGVPPEIRKFLRDLQPHYIRTRYPDAAGQVTNKLYKGRLSLKFLRGTAMVLKWCRSRLR
jgi:HEPN domain-containing protein